MNEKPELIRKQANMQTIGEQTQDDARRWSNAKY